MAKTQGMAIGRKTSEISALFLVRFKLATVLKNNATQVTTSIGFPHVEHNT
jgi:hypothetical protein